MQLTGPVIVLLSGILFFFVSLIVVSINENKIDKEKYIMQFLFLIGFILIVCLLFIFVYMFTYTSKMYIEIEDLKKRVKSLEKSDSLDF